MFYFVLYRDSIQFFIVVLLNKVVPNVYSAVWAWRDCRISQSHFLAECRKPRLSSVFAVFLLFAFLGFILFVFLYCFACQYQYIKRLAVKTTSEMCRVRLCIQTISSHTGMCSSVLFSSADI